MYYTHISTFNASRLCVYHTVCAERPHAKGQHTAMAITPVLHTEKTALDKLFTKKHQPASPRARFTPAKRFRYGSRERHGTKDGCIAADRGALLQDEGRKQK